MKLAELCHRLRPDAEAGRHGLQFAAATVAAYAAARAVGLPEHFWAVMTTLIVMRPNAASTFDAGFDRIGATVVGALLGVLGVASQRLGVNPLAATLIVVVALAYASALFAALRAAPIAALIVLSSSALPGESPLLVACLRLVQIVIGIVAALSVSFVFSNHRSVGRLNGGWARLIRAAAARLAAGAAGSDAGGIDIDSAADRTRLALDRLSLLARGADRISFFRYPRALDSHHYRRIAALVGRALQDAAVLNRALRAQAHLVESRSGQEAAAVAAAALASTADAIEGTAPANLAALRGLVAIHAGVGPAEGSEARDASLLAAPLLLLSEDLDRLCHCAGNDGNGRLQIDRLSPASP
ncbi:MAG: FUSC family protein [Proteobacteria bacterium]|nr:FUSC family protein [Pseudomonadota bacterium]